MTNITTASSQAYTSKAIEYLHDMDLSAHIPCGLVKCFIPSKTQKGQTGYLIGQNIYDRLYEGWKYANYLQLSYNIDPMVLLEPPIDYIVTINNNNNNNNFIDGFIKQLNSKAFLITARGTHSFFTMSTYGCLKDDTTTTDSQQQQQQHSTGCSSSSSLTIQKVQAVPTDAYFVKCSLEKLNRTRTDWNKSNWRQSVGTAEDGSSQSNNKLDSFLRTFQSEITNLELIMSKEIDFLDDFQFFVSTQGRIIHIDYDRVIDGRYRHSRAPSYYKRWSRKSRNACLKFIKQKLLEDVRTVSLVYR